MTTERKVVAATGGLESEAIDPRLHLVQRDPINAECPLEEQRERITPTPLFYIRSNFGVPRIDLELWRLRVEGESQLELSYDDLLALPARSLLVTLECAGNGRSAIQPRVDGEPWQYGAVSTAEWKGTPLAMLLAAVGVGEDVREVLVEGADHDDREAYFARSLPVSAARHHDVLLAYEMNGQPLSSFHGFPLRLIVPGWYGMASVKWVSRIATLDQPFTGYFQRERYVMRYGADDEARTTCSTMLVRSLICWPADRARLKLAPHVVRGFAWSGEASIERVEVSEDEGISWHDANLIDQPRDYAWQRWEYPWTPKESGSAGLLSRAVDSQGRTQPDKPEWNLLGYANNAVQTVTVNVEA